MMHAVDWPQSVMQIWLFTTTWSAGSTVLWRIPSTPGQTTAVDTSSPATVELMTPLVPAVTATWRGSLWPAGVRTTSSPSGVMASLQMPLFDPGVPARISPAFGAPLPRVMPVEGRTSSPLSGVSQIPFAPDKIDWPKALSSPAGVELSVLLGPGLTHSESRRPCPSGNT